CRGCAPARRHGECESKESDVRERWAYGCMPELRSLLKSTIAVGHFFTTALAGARRLWHVVNATRCARAYRTPPMGHHSLSPFHQGAILVVLALVAGSGSIGCGVADPSPQPGKSASSASGAGQGTASGQNDPDPTHLVLRPSERRLYLRDGSPGPVASFPIAIGKEGFETPPGRYQVEAMEVHPDFLKLDTSVVPARLIKRIPPGPTNPLGERWIQFAHGEGWTLGIHGTPNPELLGQAVSHGCIRMRNADVLRVYERVRLGTPVIVEP